MQFERYAGIQMIVRDRLSVQRDCDDFSVGVCLTLYQKRYWQEATFDAVEQYQKWCQEHGFDPVTTAVHWVTQQPGITSAIIGASRPEQLDASLRTADMPDLTEQELEWLDGLWFSLPRRREFS